MSYTIEVNNRLEEYEMLKALKEERKECEKFGDENAVKAIDRLIEQFETKLGYKALFPDRVE